MIDYIVKLWTKEWAANDFSTSRSKNLGIRRHIYPFIPHD